MREGGSTEVGVLDPKVSALWEHGSSDPRVCVLGKVCKGGSGCLDMERGKGE